MKICLLLRGLHYFKDYHSPLQHIGIKTIDYRESLDNYKKNIFNAFPNDDIDVYISTYESEIQESLINDFKPKAYYLDNFPGIIQDVVDRNYEIVRNINNGIKLIDDEYDLYIITRFDLLFKLPLNRWDIKPGYINVTHKTHHYNVDDNVHIFHKDVLKYFKLTMDSVIFDGYEINEKYNTASTNKVFLLHCLNFFVPYATSGLCKLRTIVKDSTYTPHNNPLYKINELNKKSMLWQIQ